MLSHTSFSLSSLPGPEDITRVELPNGIVVLTRANFNSPSVVIRGYVQVGALFDPDEKLGLADFVASALMRGTQRRGFQQIYDALESAGASLGFDGGTHTTSFGGKALAEDLPLLLELLSEALRTPTFPEEQVERLRAHLLTGLTLRSQDTGDMASLTLDQIVYANHPYSRPEDGWPETIQAITRQDLVDFHARYYGPRGMVIAIVGAVEPEEAVDRVRAALGEWQNPRQPEPPELPPVTPLKEEVRREVQIAGKIQADIVMGAIGPRRLDEDFYSAALGNHILGQFGLMGRIGDAVRERAGLAYYAYSSLSAGVGPGRWTVMAGVNPQNVERAIDLIRAEIRRFTTEPVTAEELADSQASLIGRLPLSLETNAGVASSLLQIERFNLGLDYNRRYPDLVRAVTVEDILAAAQHYLHPDRLGIAIAGP